MPAEIREFQAKCLRLVDEYRTGAATYESAYVQLHGFVTDKAALVKDVGATFRDYQKLLDGHRDQIRGDSGGGDARVQPASGTSSVADEIAAGVLLGRNRIEKELRRHKRTRRERSESPASSGEDLPSSDKEHGNQTNLRDFGKHRRVLERSSLGRDIPGGVFAFAEDAALAEAELPPSLRITRQRIAVFKQDEAASLDYILSSPSRPEFPEQLWKAVMLGQYVDLTKVHADNTAAQEGDSIKIGNYLEWNECWEQYAKAVTMLFPNRAAELSVYQRRISKLFKAYVADTHDRVVAYDVAVRKRASKQGNLLLTDLIEYDDLFQEILHPSGTVAQGGKQSKSGRAKPGKSAEKCRRFNAGKCTNNATNCRYRHACSACGSPDHAANACEKKEKRE
jgi:hypothetical protein